MVQTSKTAALHFVGLRHVDQIDFDLSQKADATKQVPIHKKLHRTCGVGWRTSLQIFFNLLTKFFT